MKVSPLIYRVILDNSASYSCNTEEDFSEEQEKFKELDFLELQKYNPEDIYSRVLVLPQDLVLSKDQIFELSVRNIKFNVLQKINIDIDITAQLVALAEKPIRVVQESKEGSTYNTKCEVHMPGQALSLYNEVSLKEDTCTDELQEELNNGWRIIAACPQPDQRRPDYVLGRFNPDLGLGGSAKR